MKITDIQAIYPNYRQPLGGWRPYLWQIVVRVETDAGVSGYGYGYGGGGVAAVEVVNRHLRELLLDEPCDSPADIERLWDKAVHSLDPLRTRRHRHHVPQRHRPRPLGSPR